MVSLEDMSQLMIERIVNIRNSGGEMITSHHQQQQPIENRRIKIITSWMSFDDKLFDKMNVQFILQNVSLFSVWILNPRSFFKIHWNDDEFYFAFFFSFLLYNVMIDGRLMKFGHFFELCTARPLNGNCSARRHVFPCIGRPAETTCIDSYGENVWSARPSGERAVAIGTGADLFFSLKVSS